MFLTSSAVLVLPIMSSTKIVARADTPIKVFMQKSTMLDKLESSNAFSARCENGIAAHLKKKKVDKFFTEIFYLSNFDLNKKLFVYKYLRE